MGEALIRALPFQDAARTLSAAPDLRVGGFTLALAVVTGVGFGLVPALRASHADLAPALKSEATAVVGGGGHFRLRKGLVVAQVALSLLLLIGAGLFTRSLMNLRALDPGFKPDRLFAFDVDPARSGQDFEQRVATLRRIQDELAGEPGVASASAAGVTLMTDSNSSSTVRRRRLPAEGGGGHEPRLQLRRARLLRDARDPARRGARPGRRRPLGAPRVAVVNEVFANYFFKDENPVGRRFGLGRRPRASDIEIVGVVRDGKAASLRDEPKRFVYVPYTQEESVGSLTYYVRSSVESDGVRRAAARGGRRVDPTLPVTDLKTMEAQIGESLFVERMVAALSAAFGLLATVLAAIGLYGVMSYAVAMRTREIGLRVALGADRRAVLLLVLREVAVLAALGIAIGLPGGYGLGKLVESQLFGLHARDPLTFAVATLALARDGLRRGPRPGPARGARRPDDGAALRVGEASQATRAARFSSCVHGEPRAFPQSATRALKLGQRRQRSPGAIPPAPALPLPRGQARNGGSPGGARPGTARPPPRG